MHTEDKLYGCWIKLHHNTHKSAYNEIIADWRGFSFQQYSKWKWYFRYRAARLQAEHPKKFVEWKEYSYINIDTRAVALKRLKDRITATKGIITKINNRLEKGRANWNELFPIEDERYYKEAIAKVAEKQELLKELQNEYQFLINNPENNGRAKQD